MPDLDALLYDEKTTDMAEVVAAFKEGYGEEWDVPLIRRYLITDEQRKMLFDAGCCEHDLMNGRVAGLDTGSIFRAWNDVLGVKVFGA